MIRFQAVAMLAFALPMFADTPGPHPHYLHARSQLRISERMMSMMRDEPNVMRDLGAAADRVRQAIRLLDEAAVIDRKDIDENPRFDSYPDRGGRFRAMMQMLEGAKRDLNQGEANLSAVGWRNAAIGKVNEAEGLLKKAARDDWRDDFAVVPQPHYLQAISDLRFAKALLWRRDFGNVMQDQREAIREIDQAISEAGRAAITDGRDPSYRPPVDVNWRPADRLQHAMDALNSAVRNLSYEEDNLSAVGWRQASLRDVQHARSLVSRAVNDRKFDMWFDR